MIRYAVMSVFPGSPELEVETFDTRIVARRWLSGMMSGLGYVMSTWDDFCRVNQDCLVITDSRTGKRTTYFIKTVGIGEGDN